LRSPRQDAKMNLSLRNNGIGVTISRQGDFRHGG
jgi:hypothetical protein